MLSLKLLNNTPELIIITTTIVFHAKSYCLKIDYRLSFEVYIQRNENMCFFIPHEDYIQTMSCDTKMWEITHQLDAIEDRTKGKRFAEVNVTKRTGQIISDSNISVAAGVQRSSISREHTIRRLAKSTI